MAHLIRMPRAAWKRQPQQPVEVDARWQHRKLLVAYTGVQSLDLVPGGFPSTLVNATFGSGLYGRNWIGKRGSYGVSARTYTSAAGRPMTVIASLRPAYANTEIDAVIGFGAQYEWNKAFQIYVNVVNSGDVYVGSYGFDIRSSSGGLFSAGQLIGLSVTYLGGVFSTSTVLIYINGEAVSTTDYGLYPGSLNIASSESIRFAMDSSSENRAFRGTIDYVMAFESVLPVSEIKSVHQNPWQIFRPRPARFILIPGSGGGATTHDVALLLATNATFIPISNAQYQAGITFSTLASALSNKSAQFNTTLTLDTNVSLTLARAMSTLASVSMGMTADQSANATNAAVAALTESIACSYTSQVTANLLSALSFAISQSLTATNGHALTETLTLALQASSSTSAVVAYSAQAALLTTVAASLQAALSTSASLTLPATLTVTIDGEKLSSGDVSLSLAIQAGVTSTATAMLSASVSLATQLLATPAGVGTFHTALTLSNQLGTMFLTGNLVSGSLSLAVSLAMADAVSHSLGASLSLGAVLNDVHAALASLNAHTEFPVSLAAPISGGLAMNAECALSWSLGMNSDGAYFEITVTLPTGRVVVIQASERLIQMTQTERLITT